MSEIIPSRDEVLKSAKEVLPEMAHLVPQYVSELDLIKMAAEKAFVESLSGPHIEALRLGLRALNATGKLI